jgi:N-acetylglucosamine malate deacetylase 1
MKHLIIVAHPDDEVLGCGATIAKWSKSGEEVHILIMAEGSTSRDHTRNRKAHKDELSALAKSAHLAGEILGASSVKLLDFPDNRMDSVDLLDVIKAIESHIENIQPNTVATHHTGDVNIDHKIVHDAVITACRPQPGHPVQRILVFEVPSSTEWQFSDSVGVFRPNWFVDVSQTLEIKMQALKAYSSEMRLWPHARSMQNIRHIAHVRGATLGVDAVEAFMLLRGLS